MNFTPEDVAQIAREKAEYVRGRLKRYREDADLKQDEVAKKLGVSQQAVGKWEREGTASEEHLSALWKLYGLKDSYPKAPKDPVRRKAYFEERNDGIRRHYHPPTKTIGARQ